MNKSKVLFGILASQWADCAWEAYVSNRQLKKATRTTEMPSILKGIMSEHTYDKARLYNIDKMKFELASNTFSAAMLSIFLYKGYLADIWYYVQGLRLTSGGEISTTCLWMFCISAIQATLSMPFDMFEVFGIEQKHGFNKAELGPFFVDELVMFFIGQTVIMPLTAIIVFIIKNGGKYFFLWLWLALGSLTLLLATIYPTLIAPIHDDMVPLEDGPLRRDIEALANELNFPLSQLYVVKGSERSSHSNAYFAGMFNHKAIVLFDTLFENPRGGCTNEEILAVLCHEMGHWHYNHMLVNLLIAEGNLFVLFLAFSWLFNSPHIYQAIGFRPGTQPVLVGLMVTLDFIMLPFNVLMRCMYTWLSRKLEFQADRFAVKHGKGPALASALTKLYRDNLEYPIYDPVYAKWRHSHPQLLERLEAIKKNS